MVILGSAFGLIDPRFAAVYFLVTTGVVLSWFSIYSDVWSFRHHGGLRQVLALPLAGIVENLGVRQWKTLLAWRALVEYRRGEGS